MFKVKIVEPLGSSKETKKGGFIRKYLVSTSAGKSVYTFWSKQISGLPDSGELSVSFGDFGFIES